jgi:hypothetical protein
MWQSGVIGIPNDGVRDERSSMSKNLGIRPVISALRFRYERLNQYRPDMPRVFSQVSDHLGDARYGQFKAHFIIALWAIWMHAS